MNFYKLLLVSYILKIMYDLSMWLYGYFLHSKWVAYMNTSDNKYRQYTYQIRKYLNLDVAFEIFDFHFKETMIDFFTETHGYYRHQLLLNFWPFYWISFMFNIPHKLLNFIGIKSRKLNINLINVISWLSAFLIWTYNDEIVSFIKVVINSIFENLNK